MIDPTLLQALADRIAGIPTNGYDASKFAEPLATLWRDLDAAGSTDPTITFMAWAGTNQARMDLAADILNLSPGAPPPPDPWTIYTLRDAYKPRPPLQWIVQDTITMPSLIIVYGAPGSFKTMLVQDLMVSVAAGMGWLPPLDPSKPDTTKPTSQVPCLWCDFDNGSRRTHERFEALSRSRALPDSVPLFYVSMPSPWLNCSDPAAIEDLRVRILRLGAKLVVIDNLGVVSGEAEENSAEMIQVMSALRRLAEATGVAIILLHHQRKSNGSMTGRAGESLRGHGSIEAAIDLALLVCRDEQSDEITVKSTKTRDVDVFPLGAQFDYAHKPGTTELATAQFWGVVVDNPGSKNLVQNAISDLVKQQGPINQTFIVQAVRTTTGASRHSIRRAISDLLNLGMLVTKPGPCNAVYYEVP